MLSSFIGEAGTRDIFQELYDITINNLRRAGGGTHTPVEERDGEEKRPFTGLITKINGDKATVKKQDVSDTIIFETSRQEHSLLIGMVVIYLLSAEDKMEAAFRDIVRIMSYGICTLQKELLISARDTFNESAIDERYYVNIENTPVSAVPDEAEKFAGAIKVTYSVSIVDILAIQPPENGAGGEEYRTVAARTRVGKKTS